MINAWLLLLLREGNFNHACGMPSHTKTVAEKYGSYFDPMSEPLLEAGALRKRAVMELPVLLVLGVLGFIYEVSMQYKKHG